MSLTERSRIGVFAVLQTLALPWILVWAVSCWWLGDRRLFGTTSEALTAGWLITLLGLFITSRWALVAYIDAMSFPANIRYLMIIYPALVALIVVTVPAVSLPRKQTHRSGKHRALSR